MKFKNFSEYLNSDEFEMESNFYSVKQNGNNISAEEFAFMAAKLTYENNILLKQIIDKLSEKP